MPERCDCAGCCVCVAGRQVCVCVLACVRARVQQGEVLPADTLPPPPPSLQVIYQLAVNSSKAPPGGFTLTSASVFLYPTYISTPNSVTGLSSTYQCSLSVPAIVPIVPTNAPPSPPPTPLSSQIPPAYPTPPSSFLLGPPPPSPLLMTYPPSSSLGPPPPSPSLIAYPPSPSPTSLLPPSPPGSYPGVRLPPSPHPTPSTVPAPPSPSPPSPSPPAPPAPAPPPPASLALLSSLTVSITPAVLASPSTLGGSWYLSILGLAFPPAVLAYNANASVVTQAILSLISEATNTNASSSSWLESVTYTAR